MFQGVKEIKVAGVTFNNQDGTSRQDLLRKFDAVDEVAVSLQEHEHKGQPAFHVLVDGEIIGNIPGIRPNLFWTIVPASPLMISKLQSTEPKTAKILPLRFISPTKHSMNGLMK